MVEIKGAEGLEREQNLRVADFLGEICVSELFAGVEATETDDLRPTAVRGAEMLALAVTSEEATIGLMACAEGGVDESDTSAKGNAEDDTPVVVSPSALQETEVLPLTPAAPFDAGSPTLALPLCGTGVCARSASTRGAPGCLYGWSWRTRERRSKVRQWMAFVMALMCVEMDLSAKMSSSERPDSNSMSTKTEERRKREKADVNG